MFRMPEKGLIERLKKEYPKGCRVQLVSMSYDPNGIMPGTKGVVDMVDDLGTIHVTWENGRQLGVCYGEDFCRRI